MKKDYKFSPAKMMLDFYKSISARDGNIDLTVKDIASWLEEKTNGDYMVIDKDTMTYIKNKLKRNLTCYCNDYIEGDKRQEIEAMLKRLD